MFTVWFRTKQSNFARVCVEFSCEGAKWKQGKQVGPLLISVFTDHTNWAFFIGINGRLCRKIALFGMNWWAMKCSQCGSGPNTWLNSLIFWETATFERPHKVTEVIWRQVLFHMALADRYKISIRIINSSAASATYSPIDNSIKYVLSAYVRGSLLQFTHVGSWLLLWNLNGEKR